MLRVWFVLMRQQLQCDEQSLAAAVSDSCSKKEPPVRKLLIFVVLLMMLALVAVFFLPAKWVLNQAPMAEMGLDMGDVKGSLWEGSVEQVTVDGVDLGEVRWKVDKSQALTGKFSSALEIKGMNHHITAQMDQQGEKDIALQSIKGYVGASTLAAWMGGRLDQGVDLDGRIELDFSDAQISGAQLKALNGQAEWVDAKVRGKGQAISLGKVRTQVQTMQAGVMQGTINDEGGELGLDGVYQWAGQQYEVDMVMTPRSNSQHLTPLLKRLGNVQPDGSIVISRRGQRGANIQLPPANP